MVLQEAGFRGDGENSVCMKLSVSGLRNGAVVVVFRRKGKKRAEPANSGLGELMHSVDLFLQMFCLFVTACSQCGWWGVQYKMVVCDPAEAEQWSDLKPDMWSG